MYKCVVPIISHWYSSDNSTLYNTFVMVMFIATISREYDLISLYSFSGTQYCCDTNRHFYRFRKIFHIAILSILPFQFFDNDRHPHLLPNIIELLFAYICKILHRDIIVFLHILNRVQRKHAPSSAAFGILIYPIGDFGL